MKKRKITLLGSTGSIGTQTLEIVDEFSSDFEVMAISCHSDYKTLAKQIEKYHPREAVIVSRDGFDHLEGQLDTEGAKWLHGTRVTHGKEGLVDLARADYSDTVVVAIVGNDALLPTLGAIETRKRICLANKEVLVTSGHLIMPAVKEHGAELIPVDSEHSAVFQSLQGSKASEIEKVILTASGGPFRTFGREALTDVKAAQALKHPNWDMGKKITIDSATLMNKGLEVIEAKWLFDLEPEQIEVVVHPQSIIHSMIQFKDSSVIAQLGLPDMRLPILYALTWPDREYATLERMDLTQIAQLTFEAPRTDDFPCLTLAYEAMKRGGTVPTVLNAANEVLVERYLRDDIGFYDIPRGIRSVIDQMTHLDNPSLDHILKYDAEARKRAADYLSPTHP